MQSAILRNEFATVLVATDNATNGCRLLIRDLHGGTEIYLGPPALEALTRIPHGLFGIWLDPDLVSRA